MSELAYTGYIETRDYSGDVSLLIGEKTLVYETPFASVSISYVDITMFTLSNYAVQIQSDTSTWRISRLGIEGDWFYRELKIAYNQYVRQALLIDEQPRMRSEGTCIYQGITSTADIEVFSGCLCILPPNKNARRVPYLFINNIEQIEYAIRIRLVTDEFYILSMLGRDLDPLYQLLIKLIKETNQKNSSFVRRLDKSVTETSHSGTLPQLKENLASVINRLPAGMTQVLDKKVRNSKVSETYKLLQKLTDPDRMAIGINAMPENEFEILKQKVVEEQTDEDHAGHELSAEQEDALRWIIWIITPAKGVNSAFVEFCFPDQDAATYIFKFDDSYDVFLMQLNRGLEASDLRREVLSLSEQQLQSTEFAETRVLVERTPALQMLRSQYIGRVIHRSLANWQKNIESYL